MQGEREGFDMQVPGPNYVDTITCFKILPEFRKDIGRRYSEDLGS